MCHPLVRLRLVQAPLALLLLGAGATPVLAQIPGTPDTVVIEGTVRDTLSSTPLPLTVVRVAGVAGFVLTDDAGRYRVRAESGDVRLDVRRIGYQPATVVLHTDTGTVRADVSLTPVPVVMKPVTVTADDAARRIVAAAIARKRERFRAIHDYRYDAYVKFVVRDLDQPADSASSITLITESRTSAYWQQPDLYQETILARRQSSNINAERNLVTVGQIVNFNRNRIDLGPYSLVSPIADDALDAYRYRLLDTLLIDGRRTFRLAIEPKTNASPLFVGVMDILDSTYDVASINVGVNDAVRFRFIRNLRYQQRLTDVGGGWWMPYEIRLTGEVFIGMPLLHLAVPIPHFPRRPAFEQVATLDHFRFNQGAPPTDLREFRVIVADDVDRPDSATWSAPAAIPLSAAEQAAWQRIDSLRRLPPSMGDELRRGLGAVFSLANGSDAFRYNRVDGADLGISRTTREIPGLMLDTRVAYAAERDAWQYRFGGQVRLSDPQRLWVGASYHDETVPRATLGFGTRDATFGALLFGIDRLDYYRERGLTVSLSTKLIDFTQLDLAYNDQWQSSLPAITDYSVFPSRLPLRSNPPIAEGRLRSVSAALTYDTRRMMRRDHMDFRLGGGTWTRITASVEVAAPDFIANDFNFRSYAIHLEQRQRTLGLGFTTLAAAAGLATGQVPPQRYFAVDVGARALTFQGGGVRSLSDSNFYGTRAAMATLRHDFGRLLFAKSHLPLIRRLPFTLSVEGGVFWTAFAGQPGAAADTGALALPSSITTGRAGFQIGNLTPFLTPFDFGVRFDWQFSSFLHGRFRVGIDLGG